MKLKKCWSLAFALGLMGQLHAQKSSISSIYFASGSAQLDKAALKTLDSFFQHVARPEDCLIYMEAMADETGTEALNVKLTEQRGESVKKQLQSLGLKANFDIKSLGIVRGLDYSHNRRVDIYVQKYRMNSLSDFFEYNNQRAKQVFLLKAQEGGYLRGQKGGLLYVPFDAFLNAKGETYQGTVRMEWQEAYQAGDMIAQNLTTLSDGKMLQTGGMAYLQAMDTLGKDLKVAKDKSLKLSMPVVGTPLPNTNLFTASRQESSQNLRWLLQPTPFDERTILAPLEAYEPLYLEVPKPNIIPLYAFDSFAEQAFFPAYVKAPVAPVPPALRLLDEEKPSLSDLKEKHKKAGNESDKAYEKRMEKMLESEEKKHQKNLEINQKTRATYETHLKTYHEQHALYVVDSVKYAAYEKELFAADKRLKEEFEKANLNISVSNVGENPENPNSYGVDGRKVGPMLSGIWMKTNQDLFQRTYEANREASLFFNLPSLSVDDFNKINKQGDKLLNHYHNSLLGLNKEWTAYADVVSDFICMKYANKSNVAAYLAAHPFQAITYNGIQIQPSDAHYNLYLFDYKLREAKKVTLDLKEKIAKVEQEMQGELNAYTQHFSQYLKGLNLKIKENHDEYKKYIQKENLVRKKKNEEYERELANRVDKGDIPFNALRYTSYLSGGLGWINCDRFLGYSEAELETLKLQKSEDLEAMGEIKYYLIFKKLKSILPYEDSQRVPRNSSAFLVVVQMRPGQGLFLFKDNKEYNVSELSALEITPDKFKKINLEEFKQMFAGFNF